MVITDDHKASLDSLFHLIRVRNINPGSGGREKVEQITAYLGIINSFVRKLSTKRTLFFVDSAAGNCYLSFLAYHYFRNLQGRTVAIHCIDSNGRLMARNADLAERLGFTDMTFQTGDILEYSPAGEVDVSYSLHACDTATDKALWLGVRSNAKCILSVSCCQHSVNRRFRNRAVKGVTRYRALKDRLLYLVADAMRAHLVEMQGYTTDIFEFTSSRNTDKNVMIRAVRTGNAAAPRRLEIEYDELRRGFNIEPALSNLLHTYGRR